MNDQEWIRDTETDEPIVRTKLPHSSNTTIEDILLEFAKYLRTIDTERLQRKISRDEETLSRVDAHKRATAAIERLILEGKIAELENVRDNFVTPDKGGVESFTNYRIATLTAQMEKSNV